MRQEEM